jgi:ubiquinone/menaquinone biosynthesis C-methylase UbiE
MIQGTPMKLDGVNATDITRETYNQIASGYAQRIDDLVSNTWIGEFEKSLLDRLVAFAMAGAGWTAEILDIGCGCGKDTFYLSQKKGITAIGLDYSSGMLSEARRSFPGVYFTQMDMRNLGFSGNRFQGVWANGCVYHVPKRELIRVLIEVRRVLRPAAVFSFNFKVGTGEQLERNPRSYGGKPRFYAYYGIEEMRGLVARAGLNITEVAPYPKAILGERIVQMWAAKP